MIQSELTRGIWTVTSHSMRVKLFMLRSGGRAVRVWSAMLGAGILLSACVSVSAPDKPIVINLNIKIDHSVVVSLASDAKNTIDNNPGVF